MNNKLVDIISLLSQLRSEVSLVHSYVKESERNKTEMNNTARKTLDHVVSLEDTLRSKLMSLRTELFQK